VKESVILSLRAYEICVDFQYFWSGFYEILQRQFLTETEWNCVHFMPISSLKFDVQVPHMTLLISCEFYENQCREGCTFLMGINAVMFICIL